jgi:hypothetical protein
MSYEERLLGFDARLPAPAAQATWTPERAEAYLLRADLDAVLSVDRVAWPGISPPDKRLRSPARVFDLGLWDDVRPLAAHLQADPVARQQAWWAIAVTLLIDAASDAEVEWWTLFASPAVTSTVDASWTFLGYDIADGPFSGLSNCGYRPDEIGVARELWGAHLNDHHLFTDQAQALACMEYTEERVPEHAPFFVFGLYRLP